MGCIMLLLGVTIDICVQAKEYSYHSSKSDIYSVDVQLQIELSDNPELLIVVRN